MEPPAKLVAVVVVPEKLEAVTAPANVAERSVLIVNAVVPLDCSAKTPEVSAVDFRPDEPDTTPLSALMSEANWLLLIFAIIKMPAWHRL